MNLADQRRLAQETNQKIVDIRRSEIDYYVGLNIAIGTQSALIGGFTYAVYTINKPYKYFYCLHVQDAFWVISSATIAASVHIIVNTMMLQVMGPGLALHGPVGSMARAVDGMMIEQRQITVAFFVMIVLFSLTTFLSFWASFTFQAAVGSSACWLIATRFYYYYCERVYLRFYWKREGDVWRRGESVDDEPQIPNNPSIASQQGASALPVGTSIPRPSVIGSTVMSESAIARITGEEERGSFVSRMSNRFSIISNSMLPGPQHKRGGTMKENEDRSSFQEMTVPRIQNPKAIAVEGFLIIKNAESPDNLWERRYFVLNYGRDLYYFTSRIAFRENPQNHINKRPINLEDYIIDILNTDIDGSDAGDESDRQTIHILSTERESISSGISRLRAPTVMKSSSTKSVFQITLIPKEALDQLNNPEIPLHKRETVRTSWKIRMDTNEELENWLEIIRQISPTSFL
jgi:hypothetical protein